MDFLTISSMFTLFGLKELRVIFLFLPAMRMPTLIIMAASSRVVSDYLIGWPV